MNDISIDNKNDTENENRCKETSIDFSLGTKKGNNITALFISILDKEVIEKAKQYDVIVFDYNFIDNTNLINCLPNNIKYIVFDYESYFDKPIYNYPLSLEYIKFGMYFNQSIDYLPPTLKYLILGEYFNQNIDNIPISIEYLSLDSIFNHTIDNLSDNIKELYLYSNNFNYPIRKLPKNLTKLKIYTYKSIILDNNCFAEVNNLNEVAIYGFNSPLDNIKWSDSIKIIRFGDYFNDKINNLPKYLEYFEVGVDFNLELVKEITNFPETLTKFVYIDGHPKSIDVSNSLKQLKIKFPYIEFLHR